MGRSTDSLSVAARLIRIRGMNRSGQHSMAKKLAELLGKDLAADKDTAPNILLNALNTIGRMEDWELVPTTETV